jgi:hypothetical protein
MKKALLPLALVSVCAALCLLFAPPKSQAQQTVVRYVGDVSGYRRYVTNGPPNTTVSYNITQSTPGLIVYAIIQSGTYTNSLTLPVTLDASGNGSATYYSKAVLAGQTTETICSPQIGCASDSPISYTVLTPASGVAKIQYQKEGTFVDVSGTVNVLKGDTVTFKAFPSPAGSVFYSFDPVWGGTSGATGTGDTTTVTFNTVSKTTKDYKTVVATVQNGGGSKTANVIVADGVKSLSFEPIDPASTIDVNPNAGGGQRVFTDKISPADTVNRKRIRVKALTSFAANQTIYFKSFDLDDPSTDASPVDTNAGAGNDNRGGGAGTAQRSGLLSLVGANGTTSTVSAKTDANGMVSVDLTVTAQPGDNFMVAASHDQTYLNGIVVSGITLKDSTGNTVGATTPKAKASQMLTVWRRVHVEVDSMANVIGNNVSGFIQAVVTNTAINTSDLTVSQALEVSRFEHGKITVSGVDYAVVDNSGNVVTIVGTSPPPVGASFALFDDDDFNGDDGTILDGDNGEDVVAFSQTLSLMQDSDNPAQNVYAPAYIRPIYDGGGNTANDTGNISFRLNVSQAAVDIDTQLNLGRSSGSNEGNDFWVVYLQIGYQGDPVEDVDPGTEQANGGITTALGTTDDVTSSAGVPQGGEGSLVYVESSRDGDLNLMLGDDFKVRTAPHEVGHQLGLSGDAPALGIMSTSGSGEPLRFVDRHLNVLRWRVKSPGQP